MNKNDSENSLDKTQTYTEHKMCSNCGALNHLDIPKGTRVNQYLYGRNCSNCGCSLQSGLSDYYSMKASLVTDKMPPLKMYVDETAFWDDKDIKFIDELLANRYRPPKKKDDAKG